MARHLGHRDAGKDRGRSDGHAGHSGKDRVGGNGGDAQPADHAPQQFLGHFERIASDVGHADQQPHQDKQRDGGKEVVGNAGIGREFQHPEGQADVVADQPDPHKGDAEQRIGDLHPQQNQQDKDTDQDETESKRGHFARPRLRSSATAR